MTSKQFIKDLNQKIAVEGQTLITEFFITFSRFECALKSSGYTNGNQDRVVANWDTFIASIAPTFNGENTEVLKSAVDYLIQNPPKVQSLNNGQLSWRDRNFQVNEPLVNKLSQSIRDVRNNLFHGGKFNGDYQEDLSRNFILLKNSIIILDEWLELNEIVKHNYLTPIV